MYPIPWYVVLFQSIPEAIIILLLGFKLYNLKTDLKNIVMIAILISIFGYFIRLLPLIFGVHTILFILIGALLARSVAKIKFWHSIICIMTSTIINAMLQNAMLPPILNILNISINELSLYPVLIIAISTPFIVLMFGIYLIVDKYNLSIYDLSIHEDFHT